MPEMVLPLRTMSWHTVCSSTSVGAEPTSNAEAEAVKNMSRIGILEAAAAVFGERGYDTASTNEILARAGLTRGALYHHFPSKESIAAAVLEAQGEALVVPDQPVKLQAVIDLTLAFSVRLQTDMVLRASVRLAVEQSSFSISAQAPHNQSITLVEDSPACR